MKGQIAYLFPICNILTIKLFVKREQITLLNGKTTDLDWYYSRYCGKLDSSFADLLFMTFVKKNPVSWWRCGTTSDSYTIGSESESSFLIKFYFLSLNALNSVKVI